MIPCTTPRNFSEKVDEAFDARGAGADVKKPDDDDADDADEDKRNLKSCGLLYPDLMKTRSATIEHQDKQEDIEEVVEDLEGEMPR